MPAAWKGKTSPDVPEEYATNRRVGELTERERKAVERELSVLARRVRFQVCELPFEAVGWTSPLRSDEGRRGCGSLISFASEVYRAVRRETRREQRALLDFMLALTMIHEVAHAAHSHVFGVRGEDFFVEEGLVAEAGFELMNAVFGAVPVVRMGRKRKGEVRAWWVTWQAWGFLNEETYPFALLCRDVRRVRERPVWVDLQTKFVLDLLDDAWWEAKGDRSRDVVARLARQDPFSEGMSSALRYWLLQGVGEDDDPAKKYAWADNPSLEFRGVAPADSGPLQVDMPLGAEAVYRALGRKRSLLSSDLRDRLVYALIKTSELVREVGEELPRANPVLELDHVLDAIPLKGICIMQLVIDHKRFFLNRNPVVEERNMIAFALLVQQVGQRDNAREGIVHARMSLCSDEQYDKKVLESQIDDVKIQLSKGIRKLSEQRQKQAMRVLEDMGVSLQLDQVAQEVGEQQGAKAPMVLKLPPWPWSKGQLAAKKS